MPKRWRADLLHQLWRPDAFLRKLKTLTTAPGRVPASVPPDLLAALDRTRPQESEEAVASFLMRKGIEQQGARTLGEITARLLDIADDSRARPLDAGIARMIEGYVKVRGTPADMPVVISRLVKQHGIDLDESLSAFERRISRLEAAGIDLSGAEFSAEFGRDIEYYTGFVFQIEAPELGSGVNVAGGGRYDSMFSALPLGRPVPAIGSAIHTERLLAIVGG
jgi:ATP phosphoribosyltransferase regulatory subunit